MTRFSTYRLAACVALAALAAALPGCAPKTEGFQALENPRYEIEEWKYQTRTGRVLRTDHYEIFTTLTEPRLLDSIPQAVETMYAFYRNMTPTAREPEKPMPVYLFSARAEWEHFTRRLTGPRAATFLKVRNGGFMEQGVSVIEYVSHEVTFPLLAHEGYHQFLHHCANRDVPAWLNEGVAVACEGQRWGASGLKAFDPWHNSLRRNTLADGLLRNETIPLARLLRINAGHVVGGSTREISMYYGQVWALVLFLQSGLDDKYAESFAALMRAVGNEDLEARARAGHVTSDTRRYSYGRALFEAFFPGELEEIEREYVAFMRREFLNEKPEYLEAGK